jgi:putative ABC transport system permease protein
MMPAAAGVIAGFAGASALARLMETLLFETEPLDPWAFGGTAAVLLAAALAACCIPARRATRVDPASALRAE